MSDDNTSHGAVLATDPGLKQQGWRPHFQAQLPAELADNLVPVRVTAVHRSGLQVLGPGVDMMILPFFDPMRGDEGAATVGDWLLLDPATDHAEQLLDRQSLFKRRAPGTGREIQLIAANVDTVFIVTSCNNDFNIARLERYLALAREAQVTPVMVITKADLTDDADSYARKAQTLDPRLGVVVLNATAPDAVDDLRHWLEPGQTIVFVGSSGVGKSTLINTLLGRSGIATQGIREDDAKGRHTTSARGLYPLENGAWLVDTPGMRELQMVDVRDGIDAVFHDLTALAGACKFSDCRHETEPGCAIRAAIDSGQIDSDRVERWKKLLLEERRNAESFTERRARDRAFGKMIKTMKRDQRD